MRDRSAAGGPQSRLCYRGILEQLCYSDGRHNSAYAYQARERSADGMLPRLGPSSANQNPT